MEKFFFDFCQGDAVTPDDTGIAFESAERAYLEAYDGAVSMWGELLRERRDPRRCAFHVRNAQGAVMFTLPFTELLESCRDSARCPKPFIDRYREATDIAAHARKLSADVGAEIGATRSALRELARLIAQPVPSV